MSYLTNNTKSIIRSHAIKEHPNECCGVIVENGEEPRAIECENVAKHKKIQFEISPKDYLRASEEGEIKAYYHSHTDGNENFSIPDKLVGTVNHLSLIMYCTLNNKFIERE